jgi:type II secretory pathway pseudopilin PulG
MKKFSKLKTKKGFTLLETLLATCILVIVGSMLMEGFITAMGYSYNSSVYSRSAAYNSQLCLTQLSKWSMYAEGVSSYNPGASNPLVTTDAQYKAVGEYAWDKNPNFVNQQKLVFGGGVAGQKLGDVRIALYEKNTVNNSAVDLNNFDKEYIKATAATGGDNAYADNRAIFFYFPSYMGGNKGDANFGKPYIYKDTSGVLWWGYDCTPNSSYPEGIVTVQKVR